MRARSGKPQLSLIPAYGKLCVRACSSVGSERQTSDLDVGGSSPSRRARGARRRAGAGDQSLLADHRVYRLDSAGRACPGDGHV